MIAALILLFSLPISSEPISLDPVNPHYYACPGTADGA